MIEIGKIKVSSLIEQFGSPLYVYNEEVIINRIRKLNEAIIYPRKQILYACKANTNLTIMKILREENVWIDAVSPGEVEIAFRAGFKSSEILYTGDNTTDEEMQFCLKNKVKVNLGSLSQIERYGKMNPNSDIFVRINPDCGAGHHGHTITGGPESKFGIYFDKVNDIKSLASKYNLKIVGIHSHIGSGILDVNEFLKAIDIVLNVAKNFNELDFIDFGGGIGVPYRPTDKEIDLIDFGKRVSDKFQNFCKSYGKDLYLYLEPGRFLVAESGTLLASVVNIKET
ncbi:MAG: diaminopimelate decarboxylase, partial [Spirochaetota bacterium]|nr:diaminopimelate decarboxylase [Spirochaetota bacterium]